MAPRKRAARGERKLSTSSKSQPTKIIKRTNQKTTGQNAGVQKLERPTAPPGRTYPVVTLENGLVSMENTPDYLVAAVQRNAIESPLLQLPAEIRHLIFSYAMGGSRVHIQHHRRKFSSKKWRETSQSVWHGRATHLGHRLRRQGTAFHLPEVCRQIYSETATLGYATNTFILPPDVPEYLVHARSSWYMQRNAAQVSAITSVQPYVEDVDTCLESDEMTFKSKFPALEEVHIDKSCWGYLWIIHDSFQWSSSELRVHILDHF